MSDPAHKNCPFYGHQYVNWIPDGEDPITALFEFPRWNLISSGGNQCALVLNAHAPCYLAVQGEPVEWAACERVKLLRLETK